MSGPFVADPEPPNEPELDRTGFFDFPGLVLEVLEHWRSAQASRSAVADLLVAVNGYAAAVDPYLTAAGDPEFVAAASALIRAISNVVDAEKATQHADSEIRRCFQELNAGMLALREIHAHALNGYGTA